MLERKIYGWLDFFRGRSSRQPGLMSWKLLRKGVRRSKWVSKNLWLLIASGWSFQSGLSVGSIEGWNHLEIVSQFASRCTESHPPLSNNVDRPSLSSLLKLTVSLFAKLPPPFKFPSRCCLIIDLRVEPINTVSKISVKRAQLAWFERTCWRKTADVFAFSKI